jgi:hypothetical protein
MLVAVVVVLYAQLVQVVAQVAAVLELITVLMELLELLIQVAVVVVEVIILLLLANAGGSGIVIARYSGLTQKAYGGTVTNDGSNTIHTFNSSGDFYTGSALATGGHNYI